MSTSNKIEIVFHVDENLEEKQIEMLEALLQGHDGIWEAQITTGKSHLMRVAYNPALVNSADVLGYVRGENLHVERIG
ncbi:MAG TPA: hypothetical protein EYN73_06695 [Chromatiaceae bacterium]|jgi:hypothetical protein|nr:hypothetical protein [Chromatiaceae bacterium]HIN81644.1 hypothetical protein [Chromatiales bacterium]HIA08739.1 hypothetical protein [Chromatiaceae bacterium]HIB83949.1 hypothetical protein [Chromatiaceae bacterium]HIO14602.1 hypothetical protein [Chromatiales bacterium]